jgi:hypothetical protein
MSKKIAICLSGFPRTMNHTYPYFKKYVIDVLNPDVFYFGYEDKENGIHEKDIIDTYKPTNHVIREYNQEVKNEIWETYGTDIIENAKLAHYTPEWILSQYYNLYKSNELKCLYEQKNNFKYDVVYRMRTDYYFFRTPESDVEKESVHIPHLWNFNGVSSGFAYGDSKSMDIYSSLFFYIKKYNLEDGCVFHPETIKGFHLEKQGLTVVAIDNSYWWELVDFKTNNNESSYIKGMESNPTRRNFT